MHEDTTTKVQWFYKEYVSRTYTPDFHDIINNIVYEVKPSQMISLPTDEMIRKMASLRNSFKFCEYIEDKDILV